MIPAARNVAKKGSAVWLGDSSTYPLLFLISAGVVMLTSTGVRHLTRCPDVKVNREIRKHPELALKDDEAWRSHRKVIANMAKNPVNTRSYFD